MRFGDASAPDAARRNPRAPSSFQSEMEVLFNSEAVERWRSHGNLVPQARLRYGKRKNLP